MRRRSILFVSLCTLAALSTRAGATTFAPTDFADLVTGAAAIVHGRVSAARSDWVDGRGRIDTFVTIDVEAYLKGNLGPIVELQVPGGELGRYRDVVVGAPKLAPGDDVVLFVSTKGGRPHVLGMMLGVFRVQHVGAQALVSPAPAVALGGDARRIIRGSRVQAAVSMASFAAQVGEIMNAPRGRARQ